MSTKVAGFLGIASHKEKDQDRFFGRDSEIAEAIEKLLQHRLVVLSGASGSGKTSLLLAGIVPTLRLIRLTDFGPDDNPIAAGFPVVLRDWGEFKSTGAMRDDLSRFAEFIAAALKAYVSKPDDGLNAILEHCRDKKITRLPIDRFQADVELYQAAIRTAFTGQSIGGIDGFENLLGDIAARCGGLTLVFDQLEEVLRINSRFIDSVNIIMSRLRALRGIRIVLSLREEYLSNLRQFELRGGGLDRTHVYVRKFSVEAATTVFQRLCEVHNEQVSEGKLRISPDMITHLENQFRNFDGQWTTATVDRPSIEMIYLSGVLGQLLRRLVDKGERAEYVLDSATLKQEFPSHNPILEALQSIFDDCFGDAPQQKFRRFVAGQIAPSLTSGGYKLSQLQSHLFKQSFGERLKYLNQEDIKAAADRMAVWNQNVSAEGGTAALTEVVRTEFTDCLKALSEKEIVKPFPASTDDTLWELSHDRLGMPFLQWADEQKHTFWDCVADPLGSKGVSPIKVPRQGIGGEQTTTLRNLSWLGCYVEPERGKAEPDDAANPVLRNVVFDNCLFAGTAFDRLDFDHCTFLNCSFDGALFKRCSFVGCRFEGIGRHPERAEGDGGYTMGFLGCSFTGATSFERCMLNQPAFSGHASSRSLTQIRDDLQFKDVGIKLGWFGDADPNFSGKFVFKSGSTLDDWTCDPGFRKVIVEPEKNSAEKPAKKQSKKRAATPRASS